ncbi:MAG: hypothetical protein Q9214_001272 [Letrouitia sp. 1 TL-2023]
MSAIIEEKRHADDPEPNPSLLPQPEARPISHDQLVVEVKGIYAELVMVEAKCIEVDEQQPLKRVALTDDQWQSLIALHKVLLHEHHDFFLASQTKYYGYSMPTRMWRHGIHSFLEVLRHRLPASSEHMLAFLYIAYSSVALLYETIASFEDTWIECLGDLARYPLLCYIVDRPLELMRCRYRMATEDDEPKDRQVWANFSRFWYHNGKRKRPTMGYFYHHLADLARFCPLWQLSVYMRSLMCNRLFMNTRRGIATLYNPIWKGLETPYHKCIEFDDPIQEFIKEPIGCKCIRLERIMLFLKLVNLGGVFDYEALTSRGQPRSVIRRACDQFRAMEKTFGTLEYSSKLHGLHAETVSTLRIPKASPLWREQSVQDNAQSIRIITEASDLIAFMFDSMLTESNADHNLLPMAHAMLIFIWSVYGVADAKEISEKSIPWTALCDYLNTFVRHKSSNAQIDVPVLGKNTIHRPLPEDLLLHGHRYTLEYFPDDWFTDVQEDNEERLLELPYLSTYHIGGALWVGTRISSFETCIRHFEATKAFLLWDRTVSRQLLDGTAVRVTVCESTFTEAAWSASRRAAGWETAAESRFCNPLRNLPHRFTQKLSSLFSRLSRILLLVSCFDCTVALPTQANTPPRVTEDRDSTLGSLSADVASLLLVFLVPAAAELLVKWKRLSASTLLIVIFMAVVLDIIMVHHMTAAGAPMSQADVLNLSLPSASLALGTTAIVLRAHRQHDFEQVTENAAKGPTGG